MCQAYGLSVLLQGTNLPDLFFLNLHLQFLTSFFFFFAPKFLPQGENQGDMAYRKDNYRKLGNAVCPPLIAALAGAVLDNCQLDSDKQIDWTKKGRDTAVAIAFACTVSNPVKLPIGCMVVSGEDSETSAADSQESS